MPAVDRLVFREKALTSDWAAKSNPSGKTAQRVNKRTRAMFFFFGFEFPEGLSERATGGENSILL